MSADAWVRGGLIRGLIYALTVELAVCVLIVGAVLAGRAL